MQVLIAEDDLDIANLYKQTLERRNHNVTITSNGEDCLKRYLDALYHMTYGVSLPSSSYPEILATKLDRLLSTGSGVFRSVNQSVPYDVVILDYNMPSINGMDVAKEMVRVTKPGGKIVMGNWIPGDPTLVAQLLKISSAYTPPPPEGFISPMLWGVEDQVIDRFTKAGISKENISFSRETFTFNAAYSPAEFVQHFKQYYGPTMNAFEAAEKNGKAEELQQELERLFNSQNQSGNSNTTLIPATFLRVTVVK